MIPSTRHIAVLGMVAPLLALLAIGCDQTVEAPPLPWTNSIALGVESAGETQPVLVFFRADWCVYCTRMDREVFTDPEVAGLLQHFALTRVDIDRQPTAASDYMIEGIPAVLILDRKGNVLARESGFQKADEFAAYLKATRSAWYRDGPGSARDGHSAP